MPKRLELLLRKEMTKMNTSTVLKVVNLFTDREFKNGEKLSCEILLHLNVGSVMTMVREKQKREKPAISIASDLVASR